MKKSVPSACSDYNEKYYIDRTFNHNIFTRQDILSDKKEGKFDDLLASNEWEFKQLFQQNPQCQTLCEYTYLCPEIPFIFS